MNRIHATLRAAAGISACLLLCAQAFAVQAAGIGYARAAEGGARLRNLASDKGNVVGDLPQGGLMKVYGETAGYLDVEVPGGVEVWVYGRYLKESGRPGWLEVQRGRVAMRPSPKSEITSYPLPQYLEVGERVWVVQRKDETKPLSEDWVQIRSPEGKRAWVAEGETTSISRTEGATAWEKESTAVREARMAAAQEPVKPRSGGLTVGKENPETPAKTVIETPVSSEARQAIRDADRLFEAARATTDKDFTAARAAYEHALMVAPKGTVADRANARLEEITAHEKLESLRDEISAAEAERAAERARLQRELDESNRRRSDPLVGRYQARGWLEARKVRGADEPIYLIRWAGSEQAELISSDGRYDLSLFVGYEVGVVGGTSRAPIPASSSTIARPVQFDVMKIEVISGRTQ